MITLDYSDQVMTNDWVAIRNRWKRETFHPEVFIF